MGTVDSRIRNQHFVQHSRTHLWNPECPPQGWSSVGESKLEEEVEY